MELNLDAATMFEWQRFTRDLTEVPHYHKLSIFVHRPLRRLPQKPAKGSTEMMQNAFKRPTRSIASFTSTAEPCANCIVCNAAGHPIYACPKLKSMAHENKLSVLKSHRVCLNCLRPGHFVRQCRSAYRCQKCRKSHHTLLHIEGREEPPASFPPTGQANSNPVTIPISTHAAIGIKSNLLLMTCCVVVLSPDGLSVEARALLDSASSTSFVSQRLVDGLHLSCSKQNARIFGVAGLARTSAPQSIAKFAIHPIQSASNLLDVAAVVTPRVMCDLPLHSVPFSKDLSGISFADPDFGSPSRIDFLLGVDIFVDVVRYGRPAGCIRD